MSQYALEIEDLTKVYDNGLMALKGVNLKIKEGDFFALLGHNGAGKSTMIRIISSIIKKSSGKIKVFGHDMDTDLAACQNLLGVVSQEPNINFSTPLIEALIYEAGYHGIGPEEGKKRALYWLDKMDLLSKAHDNVRQLSGGMVRRFMLAKALMHNPRMIILDEPTAGVDITLRHDMWKFLQEINALGITIVLTTHYLEEAEYLCRNIAIIKSGEIKVNTSMKELITSVESESYSLDITGYEGQELELPGVVFTLKDDNRILEVLIDKSLDISKCFSYLTAQGITIVSLRNTQNRLERIFMKYGERNPDLD